MPDINTGHEPTREELLAKLHELQKQTGADPYLKVGEKGGISVYNLGQRFPMTGYWNQWLMLLTLFTGLTEDEMKSGVCEREGQEYLLPSFPIFEFVAQHENELAKMPDRKAKAAVNAAESFRDEAIRKATAEFQKAGLSLADAETKAYETLGITKPASIRS
jgi:hypothetical protein